MSIEYGLFDSESKEYIWLGKCIGGRFQIDAGKIVAFLAGRVAPAQLELRGDNGALPTDTDDGWNRVADWCDEDDGN